MTRLSVCLLLVAVAACGGEVPSGSPIAAPDRTAELPPGNWFSERSTATGLRFVHFNGMAGDFYYPEVMPPGVGLFDYDNDGDLDVFIVQGQMLDRRPPAEALSPPEGELRGRLFRNDLARSPASLHFTDVTEASGIDQRGYGMGVATGDIDNDGCVDLYLTSLGENRLYRNNCNGTFTDITARSGTGDRGWSVPAAFVDIDRDGWLDLFVGHYLRYTVAMNTRCYSVTGLTDYCPPHVYKPEPSHLYRNNRNGTFTDITAAAGLSTEYGPALGVATADFDGDGWMDIHVSNDSTANQLWMNQRDGTFKNMALPGGTAVSPEGMAKASMGVDAGDFDNDGDEDLFIGELTAQGADLYVNDGHAVFSDESARSGIRIATLPVTTFGAGWFDLDNDGRLDLATINGRVTHTVDALARQEKFALAQANQLFRNVGANGFEDVTARAGAAWTATDVGRGLALGDVDNDGDTDLVIGNDAGPLRLLINEIGQRAHWVGLRLVTAAAPGRRGERDQLGARVAVSRPSAPVLWRRVRVDGSYASAHDPRVIAGLGASAAAPLVRVTWPDGTAEEWPNVAIDRYTTLRQGSGRAVKDVTR